MQSQTFFGADTQLHSLLMRHIDRAKFRVHVAVGGSDGEDPDSVVARLSRIPHLSVRTTDFGPTVFHRGRRHVFRSAWRALPAGVDLLRLSLYIRRNRIKIVHATEKPRDALYGRLVSWLGGAKLVVHLHVKLHSQLTHRARWSLNKADAIIAISDYVRGTILAAGFPAEKVHQVLNGIDVSSWQPLRAGSELRKNLQLGSDSTVVTIASRLFKWKGHVELISAIAPILSQDPSAHLIIVGEDDPRAHPGGGSFRGELHQLIAQLGIARQVTFLGFVEDMEEVYAATDIFAMPSFEEPFGLVFVEAMAMEKPVVALRSGGAPEIIVHGETGLLSEPGDQEALRKHLEVLVSSPSLRRCMGRAGRRRALKFFDADRMARDLELAYADVIAPKHV